MTYRVTSVAVLLAALATAPCTWAQPASSATAERQTPGKKKLALEKFEHGAARYREGKFAEAAKLFEEAYALEPEPVLLRNLARAYEGIEGRAAAQKAIEAYALFLRIDARTPDRGAIEQRIKAMQERIDKEIALERQRDDETRRAERAEQARHAAEEEAKKRQVERRKPSAVPWIVAGVGAAGIGAGVVFGLMSNGARTTAASEATDAMTAVREHDRAKTFALAANIAFVAGGALALGGLVWGIVDVGRSEPKQSARLSLRGTSVEAILEF